MMQRIGLILVGLLFASGVLVVSLFHESRMVTSSSKSDIFVDVEYSTASAQMNSYILPYPGILPDNPMYVVKMVRDRARLLLLSRDEERFEMLLGFSDKRVGAAYYLAVGNKMPLAYSTLLKAEHYMDQVITILENNSLENEDERWRRLRRAILAHMELVGKIVMMVEGDTRVKLEEVQKQYDALLMRVTTNIPELFEQDIPAPSVDTSDEGRL